MESDNPYRDGSRLENLAVSPAPTEGGGKFPTLCTVVFIMDLVFSALRGLFAVVGLGAVLSGLLPATDPLYATAFYEVGSGAGMALFGLIGSGLLLAKKRTGVVFAWIKVPFALVSLGVSVAQLSLTAGQFPDGSAERMGAYIGGTFTLVFRLVLLGLFILAIVKAQGYFAELGDN